ncbi:MAG: hypothetical protein RLN85_14585 [Pseudomonadales bacterium]
MAAINACARVGSRPCSKRRSKVNGAVQGLLDGPVEGRSLGVVLGVQFGCPCLVSRSGPDHTQQGLECRAWGVWGCHCSWARGLDLG